MEYQDREERCIENTCRAKYTITAGEQEFFADKGFTLPKRCVDCRAKRKVEKQKRLDEMNSHE